MRTFALYGLVLSADPAGLGSDAKPTRSSGGSEVHPKKTGLNHTT